MWTVFCNINSCLLSLFLVLSVSVHIVSLALLSLFSSLSSSAGLTTVPCPPPAVSRPTATQSFANSDSNTHRSGSDFVRVCGKQPLFLLCYINISFPIQIETLCNNQFQLSLHTHWQIICSTCDCEPKHILLCYTSFPTFKPLEHPEKWLDEHLLH